MFPEHGCLYRPAISGRPEAAAGEGDLTFISLHDK